MKSIKTHRISIDPLALFVIPSGGIVEIYFLDLQLESACSPTAISARALST
jgi:hypothetical protein